MDGAPVEWWLVEEDCGLLSFDDDGGAVGKNFDNAVHEFVCVVTKGDDSVGAELGGVQGHHGEGVLAGLFAELGEDGDVAADEGLETGADGAEQVAGADDDAADDADVANDAVAGDFEGSGDEAWVEGLSGRGVSRHFGCYSCELLRDIREGVLQGSVRRAETREVTAPESMVLAARAMPVGRSGARSAVT